jgi:uncharacterized LabA/DUF88 family protein
MAGVFVYIDGFNLYRGALRKSPHKWLDVVKFAQAIAPEDQEVTMVRYFTAKVRGQEEAKRQNVYLRALETLQHLSIHKGYFSHTIDTRTLASMPAEGMSGVIENSPSGAVNGPWESLPHPSPGLPVRVSIENDEEKRSDVNLATYLIFDALRNKFDTAVVVTGDSDLTEPILLCKTQCGKHVEVINPHDGHKARQLREVAAEYRELDTSILHECQLPKNVKAQSGATLTKPDAWGGKSSRKTKSRPS